MQKVQWSVECVVLLAMMVWLWVSYLEVLQTRGKTEEKKAERTRQRRARTPGDCQDCRLAATEQGSERVKAREAWSEVKSPQGRPKTYESEGQACMNPKCVYYRDTDAAYHALRRDGCRNKSEGTPQWECGACGSKHTARLGTPMYPLKSQ